MAALIVMRDWQRSRCAICGARESHVEDHDHATGLTRAFLCTHCNWLEPGGGDRFDRYRAKNPASMLGLVINYVGAFWTGPDDPVPIDQHGSYVLAGRYGQRTD